MNNKITFFQADCNTETSSAWLAAILQFANKIGFSQAFEAFKLKMKENNYTVHQKLLTIIASILMDCEFNKDINEKLSNEKLSANMLNMDRFPDQSQINRLLTRMDENSINQLRDIHHTLFIQHSSSVFSDKDIIVDFDQSGLIANSKSYELSEKGYFPKKRGQHGYQISAAFVGEYSEAVELFLDSGNTHCSNRFDDLVGSVVAKFKEPLRNGKLIIRADSGYGSNDAVERLESIRNLKYVVKGCSSRQAAKLAKDISFDAYEQVDGSVWVYEIPSTDKRRVIIVQTLTKHGKLIYTTLITNVSASNMSAVELFHFYNGRQTIEAFFKTAKNVYSIKNLRTKKFYGIYGFLWMVFAAHNLISWFRFTMIEDSLLAKEGVKVLIKQVGRIRAYVERNKDQIKVFIPPISTLAKKLIDALTREKYEQLTFQLTPS